MCGQRGLHSVPNFVSTRFFNEQPEAVARIEALIGGETRLQACYVRQNHACLEHDTLDRLAEIRCPTLVCGCGRDPICSPTATAWLGGVPGSETVMFQDCSHFFLIEEPEPSCRRCSAGSSATRAPDGRFPVDAPHAMCERRPPACECSIREYVFLTGELCRSASTPAARSRISCFCARTGRWRRRSDRRRPPTSRRE